MPKIIKNLILALFAFYLLICGLVWGISPWVFSYYLSPYLTENNLKLADNSTIRYNPFMTQLSISNFELSKRKDDEYSPVLSLASAKIELSLWRLIYNTVHVSQFDIDGLIFDVQKSDNQLMIAGLLLPQSPSKDNAEKSNPDSTLSNYVLTIPDVNLTNSAINLDWLNHEHLIALSSINLRKLQLNQQKQIGEMAISLKVNESPIVVDSQFDLKDLMGNIKYNIAVNELNLEKFNHFIYASNEADALISGLLSLEYEQIIELNQTKVSNRLSDISFSLSNLLTRQQGAHLAIAKQVIESKALTLDIINWQDASPSITIDSTSGFELTGLNAYTDEAHLSLAKIEKLTIPAIHLKTIDEKHLLSIANIDIDQGHFSDNTSDETPPLAHFKSLNLLDLKLSEDGIAINTIDILGLGIDIKKTASSEIAGLIPFSPSVKASENPDQASTVVTEDAKILPEENVVMDEQTSPQFTMALNQIKLVETDAINLVDESVQPSIERMFELQQLDIGPFDNQVPDQLTLLKISGKSNKYANFKFDAQSKPFSETPYYKLNGLFKEVNLPEISAYIKDALQYEFDSGHLDLSVDVTVENEDINGEAKIMLRGLELGAANNPHDETLASSTSIPFNYALGMLKDGDGNVELDIPLKGKTSDPDFSLQGFMTLLVKRATMSAAQDYLITTFVPYANIVKVSMIAGDYLLKVRFNDLLLTTGEASIPESASPFLEQFSTLMTEKEKTELTICAYSTPQDIGVERPDATLTEAQHEQLKSLSITRMNAFKQYMVQERAISSSRLLLCSPKVDNSENAAARLTFTD